VASIIEVWNQSISSAINKDGDLYKAWIGQTPFTPESTIDESSDYNCGAVCNELEFVRLVSTYYVQCLSVDLAEDDELEDLILSIVDMPRRGTVELDATYRNRFKFVVVQKSNPRRATRWSILDAISYFIADMSTVQLIELFDVYNMYFELRVEGAVTTEDVIFINNTETGYIDQNFIGGAGIGEVVSYLGELVDMIKAAGVDFDILFVDQSTITKSSDAFIGTIQMYLDSDAVIKASLTITKDSDAVIV